MLLVKWSNGPHVNVASIYIVNTFTITTSTFNNVVRYQVGFFFILHENIRSFGFFFYEFHSFASELSRAADVIVFSETCFFANTCDVREYTGSHTHRADKSGGGVSEFVRDCYTSIYVANFYMRPIFLVW